MFRILLLKLPNNLALRNQNLKLPAKIEVSV